MIKLWVQVKGFRNGFDVWNLENVVHLASFANVLLSSLELWNVCDMCSENVLMTYLSPSELIPEREKSSLFVICGGKLINT